jgi:uncharacterized protein YkwD
MFHRLAPILLLLSFSLVACRSQKPISMAGETAAAGESAAADPSATILIATSTQITSAPTPTPQSLAASSPTVTLLPPEPTPTNSTDSSAAQSGGTPTESPVPSTAPTQTSPSSLPEQPTVTATEPASAGSDETSITPAACQEKAAYYGDVTVPDDTFFKQGESFTKTWRFRNEGSCTWTPDYKVVFYGGEIMDAALSNPFPNTVPPGEQVDISIDMKAPTRGGPFQSVWGFEDPNGVRFGTGSAGSDLFWVKIDVRFLDQNDQPQPDPGSQPPPPAPTGCSAQADNGVQAQVFQLINQMRSSNGLNPLSLNGALSAAALVHSTDMACHNFISHSGSDGSSWADRISAQGYQFSTYPLENIYVGDPQFGGDAQGAVTWWINSQVHRDNILNDRVTETGVGYVYDTNSEYGGYYTMVFAQP